MANANTRAKQRAKQKGWVTRRVEKLREFGQKEWAKLTKTQRRQYANDKRGLTKPDFNGSRARMSAYPYRYGFEPVTPTIKD